MSETFKTMFKSKELIRPNLLGFTDLSMGKYLQFKSFLETPTNNVESKF